MSTTPHTHRIPPVVISLEAWTELQALKRKTRAASIAEIVRRAIALYEVLVAHKEDGWRLVLMKETPGVWGSDVNAKKEEKEIVIT